MKSVVAALLIVCAGSAMAQSPKRIVVDDEALKNVVIGYCVDRAADEMVDRNIPAKGNQDILQSWAGECIRDVMRNLNAQTLTES